jgi:hypothetical protein
MNDDELGLLRELNGNVDGLRRDVAGETEIRARQIALLKAVLAAAIVLVLCGATVNGLLLNRVSNQADELAGNRVEDCERGNESRAAIVRAFDQFVTALASAATPLSDPAAQAERDARVAAFRRSVAEGLTALAPRDCSAEAVNS